MFKFFVLLSFILNASPHEPKGLPNHRMPFKAGVIQANGSLPVAVAPTPGFRSYREWKVDQIAYGQFKGQPNMADELTVADYFAGYLTKQRNQAQAIKEVSGRLSPDEVAELMTIYANSVFGSHSSAAPKSGEKEASQQP